jgi:glycerol uptake facilitator-like aquaporin
MFGLAPVAISHHARGGPALAFSEFIATFGLLVVIHGCARRDSSVVAVAVASYITAAYWFTASTSLANPAVPLFIAAQLAGGAAAKLLFRGLLRTAER